MWMLLPMCHDEVKTTIIALWLIFLLVIRRPTNMSSLRALTERSLKDNCRHSGLLKEAAGGSAIG